MTRSLSSAGRHVTVGVCAVLLGVLSVSACGEGERTGEASTASDLAPPRRIEETVPRAPTAAAPVIKLSEQYDDVPLEPDAARALQVVVDAHVSSIRATLEGLSINEPVFAVALYVGQEEKTLDPLIGIGRVSDRARLFDRSDRHGWTDIWNPFEFGKDGDLIEQPSARAEVRSAWSTLRVALTDHVLDPQVWTLLRIAHRLNRIKLPIRQTDDGIVYVFPDEGIGDDFIYGVRFAARADTYALLRQRHFIGPPEEPE